MDRISLTEDGRISECVPGTGLFASVEMPENYENIYSNGFRRFLLFDFAKKKWKIKKLTDEDRAFVIENHWEEILTYIKSSAVKNSISYKGVEFVMSKFTENRVLWRFVMVLNGAAQFPCVLIDSNGTSLKIDTREEFVEFMSMSYKKREDVEMIAHILMEGGDFMGVPLKSLKKCTDLELLMFSPTESMEQLIELADSGL